MADAKVDWKYTAPKDKACWTAAKSYTDAKCSAGEKADGSVVAKAGTAEKVDATTKLYVVSCKAGEFTVFPGTKAVDADAKTEADAAIKADAKAAKVVKFTVVKGSATSACVAWPDG